MFLYGLMPKFKKPFKCIPCAASQGVLLKGFFMSWQSLDEVIKRILENIKNNDGGDDGEKIY